MFIKDFDNNKFNNFYNSNKFNDELEEDGYGSQMTKCGIREDIEIEKADLSEDYTFSDHFKSKMKKRNNKIVKYTIPKPINNNNYKILGKKCTKFTGRANQIGYSDYIEAFSSNNIISDDFIEKNIDYESYKKEREIDPLKLSDDQKKTIETTDNNDLDEESDRLLRLDKYNSDITKHYNNTHKALLKYC